MTSAGVLSASMLLLLVEVGDGDNVDCWLVSLGFLVVKNCLRSPWRGGACACALALEIVFERCVVEEWSVDERLTF